MKECGKSVLRRLCDAGFSNRFFVGDGIDIGGGPDPLSLYQELFPRITSVRGWDLHDGDAQQMATVPDRSFDFVHSSHCLEHLEDPDQGLGNWFRIVAENGHLIVTVPDEDLYEQGVFPSTYNADHKWPFTIFKTGSWSPKSKNVLGMIENLGSAADVQRVQLLDSGFRYGLPRFDQTLTPVGECAIEFVIRKRTSEEIENGGRLPKPGEVTEAGFSLLTGISPRRS